MTDLTFDQARYLDWLYEQIAPEEIYQSHSHRELIRRLFTTEFTHFVPNDDNRAEDGVALREEFKELFDFHDYPVWFNEPCTILEMLVALCRRLEFQEGSTPWAWFWKLMDNLDLNRFTDLRFKTMGAEADMIVEEILTTLNNRTYLPNGRGGLFPLRRPKDDQRDVEIWTQASAYLVEGHAL